MNETFLLISAWVSHFQGDSEKKEFI